MMSIKENELKLIYEKSKEVSNDFHDLDSMLKIFPNSLILLRFSLGLGRKNFSKICNIHPVNLRNIEKSRNKLGYFRRQKIFNSIKNRKLNFQWSHIYDSFNMLNKKSKGCPYFDKIPRKALQEIAIKGVKAKSIENNKSEMLVKEILEKSNIKFEYQTVFLWPSPKVCIMDFTIPNGNNPKVLIEVTNGRIEKEKCDEFLTPIGNKKLLTAFRIKKALPSVKLILIATGKLDRIAENLLSEAFDFILTKETLNKLPEIISEFNAN